ncbi:unnamed protein product [Cunninghamella blakesleeana]
MVALGYVVVKQAVSIFRLEHKDDAIDALMDLCKNNRDQYKRILEAIEEIGDDKKRVKLYAKDGLLYSETCIKKYSQQSSLSTISEPLEIPPSVVPSTSTNTSPNPLLFIDSKNKKSDIEWTGNFIEGYKLLKKRMNWRKCFDMGRESGYFKTCANHLSLKSTYNNVKSKP